MYCKLCGYRGGVGETCCPDCGAPLFEVPAELLEAAPEVEEVDIKKKRRVWPGGARSALAAGFLAVCLALQGFGLWRLHRPVDQGWSYLDGSRLVTPQGVWSIEDGAWWDGYYSQSGGSCRVLTLLREEPGVLGALDIVYYFYDGHGLEETDWTGAMLSGDGQALFYQTGQEDGERAIFRRDLRTGRETEIARGRGVAFTGFCDYAGTALAYYKEDPAYGDPAQGYARRCLWQLGVGSRELEGYPYYLGKHGDSYLAVFPAEDERTDEFPYGGSTEVVVWNNGARRTAVSYQMRLDRDLTELLYTDDQGCWHYEDQAGRTQKLEGLFSYCGLTAAWPGSSARYHGYGLDRLTDQVYLGSDGVLYYLDEDLRVTRLTPEGVVDHLRLTAAGQTYYFLFRPTGQKAQLWHMERSGSGTWRQPQVLLDEAHSYVLSADGQTLCARCWEGKSLVWRLRVGDGAWQSMDKLHPRALEQDILPMDGGCWYMGDGSDLHRELWYRAPDGETQLKMAYTALYSSTMYPTDNQAEVLLSGFTDAGLMKDIEDMELIDLGRGDQALLRVGYAVSAKGKEMLSAYGPNRGEADYWLLECDGTMTKLEAMEL